MVKKWKSITEERRRNLIGLVWEEVKKEQTCPKP
jgi:hypothetical protein